MRMLLPQHTKPVMNAVLCPLRAKVGSRGTVALRAEPSTAILKQTHAREGETAVIPTSDRIESQIASEPCEASANEVEELDTPRDTAAYERHPRWKRGRRNDVVEKEKVILERHQFRCKVGDVVVGKVVYAGDKGAKIDLLDHPGVMGFMPADRGPYVIVDPYTRESANFRMAVGTIRKFQVLVIPPVMEVNGKGPLLCCQTMDLSMLWHRVGQIFDACASSRELVKVHVHSASNAGLLCSLSGLRGFIPISHIPKPSNDTWWDRESLNARFAGKDVEVSMLEIRQNRNTFTCSIRNADGTRSLRKLRVGSLVWGTVRLVRSYGVFIAIDDTQESALLHIGNISWERIYDIEDHLTVGDRVRAVVIGMDEDYSRISVSTKDLELTPGDMLINKEAVFETAEEGVKPFLEHVEAWKAQVAQQNEQDWHDSVTDTMEAEDFRQ